MAGTTPKSPGKGGGVSATSGASELAAEARAGQGLLGAIETHGSDRVTVAWQSGGARYAEISAQTLRSNGTWGSVQQIARYRDRGGIIGSLLLAANDRGDMAAVWTHAHYIRVAYRPAGSSWREPTTIPVRDAYAYDGMANVTRDGQVDVVFPGPGDARARDVYAWPRALGGAWSGESLGRLPGQRRFSAAGNPDGDLAVTWLTRDNRDDPRRVVLRYRPSGGSFTQPEILATDAKLPELDIANSGVVTVGWLARVDDLARVDLARRLVDGSYSPTQHLAQRPFNRRFWPMLGIDVNARGEGVVHLIGRHRDDRGRFVDDHRMFRCPAGSPCGDPFRLAGPSPYENLSFATAPFGGATAIYARGCATESCIPTKLLSRRMVPLS